MRGAPAAALAALLAAAAPVRAACPDWLVADMAERGVPDREVARLCGPPPTRGLAVPGPFGPAAAPARRETRQSNHCVPETGAACTLRAMRIVGSPCWCILPDGAFADGTIR